MDLGERLTGLRYRKNYSAKRLSQEVGISAERIEEIEETSDATISELVSISKFFRIDLNWFIMGTEAREIVLDYLVLIDSKVAAGYLDGKDDPDYFSKLEYYRIPGVSGDSEHRLFKVHGESMYPTLSENDYLVCGRVEESDVEAGDMVVLVTDNDIVVKRVRKNGGILILDSDNPQFKSYTLHNGDVKELWKVEAKVTRMIEKLAFDGGYDINLVSQEIAAMKQEISYFKSELQKLKGMQNGGYSLDGDGPLPDDQK